jgi:hypothetical protein
VFIGYSFPITDIASYFLFSESLHRIDHSNIKIVNYAIDEAQKSNIVQTYKNLFCDIPESNFFFDGTLEWIKKNIPT